MIIRSQIESKSQERKKLSINSSKRNSSISNLKISNSNQQKQKLSFFKPLTLKIQQQEDITKKYQTKQFPSLSKQNMHRKKSISLSRKQILFEEKNDQSCVLQPLRQNQKNQSLNYNLPLIESKNQKIDHSEVENGNKRNFSNNKLVISQLLCNSSNKKENFQRVTNKYENLVLQKEKPHRSRRISNMKKSNTVYIQKVQNELLDNFGEIDSNQINDYFLNKSQSFQSNIVQRLSLDPATVQVLFVPSTKRYHQVDAEVQTIQQEREFFEYLKYKRRKQQFEDQIQNLFQLTQFVKGDRSSCEKRILKLNGIQKKVPQNEREERIFKLTNQISKQQKTVEKMIVEKYSTFQKYTTEFQKLESTLVAQNQKFIGSFINHCKLQREALQQNQVQKSLKIFGKLQVAIRHFLKQNLKKVIIPLSKIQTLMLKSKPHKQDATQLIQAFKEYTKSINQKKNLLKNCFGHIKKIPELCYGLCGNQLPNWDLKNQLRNDNNEFEMPKCIDCFNSEWKMHMIIEKNIAMQSIFKVTAELLK